MTRTMSRVFVAGCSAATPGCSSGSGNHRGSGDGTFNVKF